MELDVLLQLVNNSRKSDWHRVQRDLLYSMSEVMTGDETKRWIELEHHHNLFVFKKDVRISLAWGATVNEDFHDKWANSFPDAHASSVLMELCFNGCPIYDWLLVVVDGGRYHFLVPSNKERKKFFYTNEQEHLARFFFELTDSNNQGHSFDDLCQRSGIELPQ